MQYVWIDYINLSLVTRGSKTYASAALRVLDQNNDPVRGAEVHSHWDGLSHDSDVFVTKRQGIGSCKSDRLQNANGCWDYYIDDVIAAGYVFRSDLGETYDQICTGRGAPAGALAADGISVLVCSRGPSNSVSEFSLSVPREVDVSLTIYDISGHRVRTLGNGALPAGSSTLIWDGTNERGEAVASGIYLYQVISGEQVMTDKMMLLR